MRARFAGLALVLTVAAAGQNCPAPAASTANWNGWSDAANTRFQPSKAAGLTVQSAAKLKLKWAFGLAGVTSAQGTPAVYGGRLFVGAPDGTVYALNAQTGCSYWTYKAEAGVRGSPVVDGSAVFVGDLKANVYALGDHGIAKARPGKAVHSDFGARRVDGGGERFV